MTIKSNLGWGKLALMASVFVPQFLCAISPTDDMESLGTTGSFGSPDSFLAGPNFDFSNITVADITTQARFDGILIPNSPYEISHKSGIIDVKTTEKSTADLLLALPDLSLENNMKHTLLQNVLTDLRYELSSLKSRLWLTEEEQHEWYKDAQEPIVKDEEAFTGTFDEFVQSKVLPHNADITSRIEPLEASEAKLQAALNDYPAATA